MSSNKILRLLSIFTVVLSCRSDPDFYGTYGYCNEDGYYVEVSFQHSGKLIIAHELFPDGREYAYKIDGDTMLTYDLEGRLLTKCEIKDFHKSNAVIVVAEEDSTYEFVYARITDDPIMGEIFKDTTDTRFREYFKSYMERRLEKGCAYLHQPSRISTDEIDTVFNDF